MDHPEHRKQHWCLELVDRALLVDGPTWFTAVETGEIIVKQGTKEEKDRARFARENKRRYQGIKPHHLDTYIYQQPLYAQIEMKDAETEDAAMKALSVGQRDTITALERNRVPWAVAWSPRSYLAAMRRIGFRLHANADNILVEIEARLAAAQDKADVKKTAPKKRARSVKAGPRYTAGKQTQARAAKAGIRF